MKNVINNTNSRAISRFLDIQGADFARYHGVTKTIRPNDVTRVK